jgi:predicted amidophosphoribosyltransferase
MQIHVRVCRECGEEYRPDIATCADCGGELEDVYEEEGAPPAPRGVAREDPEPIDLSDHRAVFQTPRAPDLVPMAERLKETGIEFHLVEGGEEGGPSRYSLVVREAEVKRALETLADLVAPHATGDEVRALETHYEAGRGYVRCPACGAEQGSGLAECAECGLTLGPMVPTCPRCLSPLEEEGAPCAVCGGPPPTG